MTKSAPIRGLGALLGAVIGGGAAVIFQEALKPTGGALGLIAFLAASGAILGVVIAMQIELARRDG